MLQRLNLTLPLLTALLTGGVMLVLAGLILAGNSPSAITLEHYGVSRAILAGLLIGGGLTLMARPHDSEIYILATFPFVFYILATIIHALFNGGSFAPAVVYTLTLFQIFQLRACQEEGS